MGKVGYGQKYAFYCCSCDVFGKEYFSIIPKEILLKVPNSQEFIINGQDVISIKLYDLYENPNLHRDSQKILENNFSFAKNKKYQENVFQKMLLHNTKSDTRK